MARGGKRPGAGRPAGSSKYGEPTRMARIPISLAERLTQIAGKDQKPMIGNARLIQLAMELIESGLEQLPESPDPEADLQENQHQIQRGVDLIRYALGLDPKVAPEEDLDPAQPLQIGDRCRYVGSDPRLEEIAGDAVLVIQNWVDDQIVTVIAAGQFVRNFPARDLARVTVCDLHLAMATDREDGGDLNIPYAYWETLLRSTCSDLFDPSESLRIFAPGSHQDQPLSGPGHHRLGPAGHIQFSEDRSDMELNRMFRDPQSFGDGFVAHSLRHQSQHLDLTGCQR